MKKGMIVSMALLTAVTVGSIPVTSYAAYGNMVKIPVGGSCNIYSGQDWESLQKTLKDLGVTIGGNGNNCLKPPAAETPDVSNPQLPDISVPDTPVPDTPAQDQEGQSYAQQVVDLVNAERAKAGLSSLTVQTDITAAANVRAREIKQQFAHTRPDGSSFSTALQQQGVSYRGSGENIAYGQSTPQQVMQGWMNSSGHRANILNANYKNIGVGYYEENGVKYWVQLFTY